VVPDVTDVRALSLEEGRQFTTKAAGLFLFLPLLLRAHKGTQLESRTNRVPVSVPGGIRFKELQRQSVDRAVGRLVAESDAFRK
jgi:hypothetical protein